MFSGDALDRHITGNYGEDQLADNADDRSMDEAYAAVDDPREDWNFSAVEDWILIKWWQEAGQQSRKAARVAKWWENKAADISLEMERRHPQDAYFRLTEQKEAPID